MKIALYHNLTSGGSKREAYEFTRRLVQHGHTVHLFRPSTANEEFLSLASVVQAEFIFPLELVPDLPLRLPGLTRYLDLIGWARNVQRLKQLARVIAKAMERRGYDCVFVHHDRLVQSPFLLRYLRTPSVYYCNEPMREFYESPIPRLYQQPPTALDRAQQKSYVPARWLRRTVTRHLDWQNVQYATLLLTNSFFSAESLYRAYGKRARVSYLGVDAEKFKPLGLARENFVVSVGAVSPFKGYDFLIEALSRLPTKLRLPLVIVGNTASQGEMLFLKQLAAKKKVAVEFRVNVTEEELVRLYNQTRALVYAPVLEPFGLAPLEAMACETPVIAVREGGVRESVVDHVTGLLVEREPTLFAHALEKVLSNSEYARHLGHNGRACVQESWTWEHAYQRLMANIGTRRGEAG